MLKSVAFDRRPTRTLSDVTTRYAEISDAAAVEAMHARCSDLTLYRRFHTPLPRVSSRLVRQMINPTGGWSIVAERGDQVIGFACVAPVSVLEAEVGLLVEDQHQGNGLGTRMLHEISLDAANRSFQSLQILAQPENDRVLSTVKKAGLIGRVAWADDLLSISVPIRRLAPAGLRQPA